MIRRGLGNDAQNAGLSQCKIGYAAGSDQHTKAYDKTRPRGGAQDARGLAATQGMQAMQLESHAAQALQGCSMPGRAGVSAAGGKRGAGGAVERQASCRPCRRTQEATVRGPGRRRAGSRADRQRALRPVGGGGRRRERADSPGTSPRAGKTRTRRPPAPSIQRMENDAQRTTHDKRAHLLRLDGCGVKRAKTRRKRQKQDTSQDGCRTRAQNAKIASHARVHCREPRRPRSLRSEEWWSLGVSATFGWRVMGSGTAEPPGEGMEVGEALPRLEPILKPSREVCWDEGGGLGIKVTAAEGPRMNISPRSNAKQAAMRAHLSCRMQYLLQ
ncbi:hypothetical protein JB92DRAFT_2837113 [Gautieria morchelliformis]|nr:hypothetical protein JB92DRAFT_2837113 [Gautieria morchelliformis]